MSPSVLEAAHLSHTPHPALQRRATYRLIPVRLWWREKMSAAVRSVSERAAMPTPVEFIHCQMRE